MAKYILKRKTYGIADAAQNTIGGVAGGIGKALDSKPAALVGGLAGAATVGSAIGTGLGTLIPGLGILAPIIGYGAGAALGSTATRGLGKGLKAASDSMMT